ncbi:MAG: bifunctional 5,10-methylenetetrahydrofolate dehydrogenase/5,10-methenyltetrahydrofolate cyclohydrolase [Clostridiales Family XIII bacterium]|nr:bifunctional 5,10-methylenetetrahydrofolate dehydrogenase/5,10-methenyltetrahydrofolate cyclohydrolase [Clostridiales Family XIII bacterium]
MGTILDGKRVAAELRARLEGRIAALTERNARPALRIIRVGENRDDLAYEKGILKACSLLGVDVYVSALPEDASSGAPLEALRRANADESIHGIMVFRPLPERFAGEAVHAAIDPGKDVDCMSPLNLERLFEGRPGGFAPCTPEAVIEMLKAYEIPLRGANVAVVGRSMVVGRPLAMLLLREDATVTLCHSRTRNLSAVTRRADIVVAAVGRARFMTPEFFGPDAVVIDVGINDDGSGKLCGDVDFERCEPRVGAISPAVGGVGAITSTVLLAHVVLACEGIAKINGCNLT